MRIKMKLFIEICVVVILVILPNYQIIGYAVYGTPNGVISSPTSMSPSSGGGIEDENNNMRITAAEADGCYNNGSMFGDGSIVPTMEPCLICRCKSRNLICSLRVCSDQPNPPPRGCVLVQKRGICCPYITCSKFHLENKFNDRRSGSYNQIHVNTKSRESNEASTSDESPQRNTNKNALFRRIDDDDEGGELMDGNEDLCIFNGTVYKSGSAMSTSTLCSYCYCIGGKQKCIKPKCLLPTHAGCEPIYSDTTCCPVRYDCSNIRNSTKTDDNGRKKNHIIHSGNKHYLRTMSQIQRNKSCLVGSFFYPEGQKLPSDPAAPCEECFCIRGTRKCTPKKCAPIIRNCKPMVPHGQCCPSSYDCDNISKEPNKSRQFDFYSLFFGEEGATENGTTITTAQSDLSSEEDEFSEIQSSSSSESSPITSSSSSSSTGDSIFDAIRAGLKLIEQHDDKVETFLENSVKNTTANSTLDLVTTISSDNLPSSTSIKPELSFLDILLGPDDEDDDDDDDFNDEIVKNSSKTTTLSTPTAQQLKEKWKQEYLDMKLNSTNNGGSGIKFNGLTKSEEYLATIANIRVNKHPTPSPGGSLSNKTEFWPYRRPFVTYRTPTESTTIYKAATETSTLKQPSTNAHYFSSTQQEHHYYDETTNGNKFESSTSVEDELSTNYIDYSTEPLISTPLDWGSLNIDTTTTNQNGNEYNDNPESSTLNEDLSTIGNDNNIWNYDSTFTDASDVTDDSTEITSSTTDSSEYSDSSSEVGITDTEPNTDVSSERTDSTPTVITDQPKPLILSTIPTKIDYGLVTQPLKNNTKNSFIQDLNELLRHNLPENTTENNKTLPTKISLFNKTITSTNNKLPAIQKETISTTTENIFSAFFDGISSIFLERNDTIQQAINATNKLKILSQQQSVNAQKRSTTPSTSSKLLISTTPNPPSSTTTRPVSISNDNYNQGTSPSKILITTTAVLPTSSISGAAATTPTSLPIKPIIIDSNPSILEADINYDYSEPTLPPSLPNLKIIPFLPTDAVKNNHRSPSPTNQHPSPLIVNKFYKPQPISSSSSSSLSSVSTPTTNYPILRENYDGIYNKDTVNIPDPLGSFKLDDSADYLQESKTSNNNDFDLYSKHNQNIKIPIDFTGSSYLDSTAGINHQGNLDGYDGYDHTSYPLITENYKKKLYSSYKTGGESDIITGAVNVGGVSSSDGSYNAGDNEYDYDSYGIPMEKHVLTSLHDGSSDQYGPKTSLTGTNYEQFATLYPEQKVVGTILTGVGNDVGSGKLDYSSTINPAFGFERNNQFSPPIKTEGGFLPKEPIKDDKYFFDNFHTTKGLIDITTDTTPNSNLTGLILGISTSDPFKNVIHTEPPPNLHSLIEDKHKFIQILPEIQSYHNNYQQQHNHKSSVASVASISSDDFEKEIISITTDSNYQNLNSEYAEEAAIGQYNLTPYFSSNTNKNQTVTIKKNSTKYSDDLDKFIAEEEHFKNKKYQPTNLDKPHPDRPFHYNNNWEHGLSPIKIKTTPSESSSLTPPELPPSTSSTSDLFGSLFGFLFKNDDDENGHLKSPASMIDPNDDADDYDDGLKVTIPPFRNISSTLSIRDFLNISNDNSTEMIKTNSSDESSTSYSPTLETASFSTSLSSSSTTSSLSPSSPGAYFQRINNKIYENPSTESSTHGMITSTTTDAVANYPSTPTTEHKVENLNILRDVLLDTINNVGGSGGGGISGNSAGSGINVGGFNSYRPIINNERKPFYQQSAIHKFLTPTFPVIPAENIEAKHTIDFNPIRSDLDITLPDLHKDELNSNDFNDVVGGINIGMGGVNNYPEYSSISNSNGGYVVNPIDVDSLKTHHSEGPTQILAKPSKTTSSSSSVKGGTVGLLKLAGCNIYGRMYRVGRIISELSGPCLECKCTEVGVHCTPLNCR